MGMKETFQIVIDVATESSQKSLKGLRSEVSNTEGGFNKFKTGVSGSLDYVKDHAGAFALGAGAALVGFGVKAVAAFEDAAKAALDLGSATGLSVEDASRWIAVGDDFQISAEAIQGSIGKIGKTLDSGKWESYGIATRDAGGNARSTNDILLDSLDYLSSVTNQTERARIGNELFGKGYQNLTPMIGHTRTEYEKMLGAVEAGQVITKSEAANAERMRLAQDKLSDALKEVTLQAGAAAVKLAPIVTAIADIISSTSLWGDSGQSLGAYEDALAAMDDKTKGASTSTKGLANGFLVLREELQKNMSGLDGFFKSAANFNPEFNENLDATNQAFNELLDKDPSKAQATLNSFVDLMKSGDKEAQDYLKSLGITQGTLDKWQIRLDEVNGAQGDVNNTTEVSKKVLEDAAKAQAEATKAIEEHKQALLDDAKALQKNIDAQRAYTDAEFALKDAQDSFTEALDGSAKAVADANGDLHKIDKVYRDITSSATDVADAQVLIAQKFMEASGETLTATEKLDLFNNSMLDSAATAKGKARDGILDYIATFNSIPDSKMTEIKTAINEGDLKKATWLLAAASASRTVALTADADVTQATSDLDAAAAARTVAFYGALMPGVQALGVSAPAPVVPDMPSGKPSLFTSRQGSLSYAERAQAYADAVARNVPKLAEGGIVQQATLAVVGEAGPEAVVPLSKAGALGGTVNNITINTGADPQQVLQIIKRYTRNGGVL